MKTINVREERFIKEPNSMTLFLAGMIILFFRSAFTVIYPSLFAEDSSWMSELLSQNFFEVFFQQRYFMTGYLLLEEIAITINKLLFGENIRYIPYIVAFVSYTFHSLVAVLAIRCLKDNVILPLRYLAWLLILLMPVGEDGFEIFGHILNYGYMFYFIAFILVYVIIFKVDDNTSKIKQALIFILLLISSTTNAAANALFAFAFFFDIGIQYKELSNSSQKYSSIQSKVRCLFSRYKNKLWVILGIVCVLCMAYQAVFMQLFDTGSDGTTVNSANIIEAIGRSILYYFTWSIYNDLNNTLVLVMLAALVALVVAAMIFTKNANKERLKLTYFTVSTLIILLATLVMRPGLTGLLDDYQSTYPDRYYYVINICVLITVIYALHMLSFSKTKIISYAVSILLLLPIICSPEKIFQFDDPETSAAHTDTFISRVSSAKKSGGYTLYRLILGIGE